MNQVGTYKIHPFSKNRQNIVLILKEGARRHFIHALLEPDVTDARMCIRNLKQCGTSISFTAWFIKCVAEAVSEHKILNSYRLGRRKIVVFDDIDIPIPIERKTEKDIRPMAYIIRKVNEKNIIQITEEIEAVKNETVNDSIQVLGKNLSRGEELLLNAPQIIKKLAIFIVRGNGIFRKKHMGTVGVTSIGTVGTFPGWVIPIGGSTASLIAVGGIVKKPGVKNNTIMIREYLHVTVSVDHDIVDGGPLTRFTERLIELIETCHGLHQI